MYLGGIGGGKTLSVVREIVEKEKQGSFAYTNFTLKNIKKWHRIKVNDILIYDEDEKNFKINWKFWDTARNDNPNFCIYIDEAQYIAGSRSSMSKRNKALNLWLSQIRKVLSNSQENHLYFITQRYRGIDVAWRELTHFYIVPNSKMYCPKCEKEYKFIHPMTLKKEIKEGIKRKTCMCFPSVKKSDMINLVTTHIFDYIPVQGFEQMTSQDYIGCKIETFVGNDYYKYYDTFEIQFRDIDGEYL
jgi:hypothetical protein